MLQWTSAVRAFALGALLLLVGTAQAAPQTLVYANAQNADHPSVQLMEAVAREMARTSPGLEIQIQHSARLGSETETLARLQKGQLDLLDMNLAALATTSHTANILTLPFLFKDQAHAWKVFQGKVGQRLEAELLTHDMVLIGFIDNGYRVFYSREKPIYSRQDFKGLRVRVSAGSAIYTDFVRQLGATPVSLAYNDILPALKEGKVDVADGSVASYMSSEHFKYAKYLSYDEHSVSPDLILMSKKAWSSLSPVQQKQLKASVIEENKKLSAHWQRLERELLADAHKVGVTVIPHDKLSLNGIEDLAYRSYSKYLQDPKDLDLVLAIFEAGAP